jgi:hypothetical protein
VKVKILRTSELLAVRMFKNLETHSGISCLNRKDENDGKEVHDIFLPRVRIWMDKKRKLGFSPK